MAGTGWPSASAGSQIRAASLTPSESGMNTFSISVTFFGKLSSARIVVLLLLRAAGLGFDTRVFGRGAQEAMARRRARELQRASSTLHRRATWQPQRKPRV